MQYLIESTSETPIEILKNQFEKQGYLLLRSFFPTEIIQKVRNAVVSVLEDEQWGTYKEGIFHAIAPARRINSPAFHACIAKIMAKEIVHELADTPSLQSFLSELLGEKVYAHPRKMARITFPHDFEPNDRIPPHQDLFYVKGEQDTFTAWIPLGDYPPELGGLLVSPGTHKMGLLPTKANDEGRFGCNAVEDILSGLQWYQAHYHVGDVLIMHGLTLHQSGYNKTQQFRLSLDCRFSSAHGHINEEQLLPPYYPHVPSWQKLSEGWARPDRFTAPNTLIIDSKDKPLSEVMSSTTRFAK
jgi:ectoine hydroxylase-related dioxygenase (phytanoyl-CoA dioxygenase family)